MYWRRLFGTPENTLRPLWKYFDILWVWNEISNTHYNFSLHQFPIVRSAIEWQSNWNTFVTGRILKETRCFSSSNQLSLLEDWGSEGNCWEIERDLLWGKINTNVVLDANSVLSLHWNMSLWWVKGGKIWNIWSLSCMTLLLKLTIFSADIIMMPKKWQKLQKNVFFGVVKFFLTSLSHLNISYWSFRVSDAVILYRPWCHWSVPPEGDPYLGLHIRNSNAKVKRYSQVEARDGEI